MNDKDKEAFGEWWDKNGVYRDEGYATVKDFVICEEVWRVACEYKQKEIIEIELREAKSNRGFVELASKFCKLQAKNEKLVCKINLALFIMKDNEWHNDEGSIEYQVYKILEKVVEEL